MIFEEFMGYFGEKYEMKSNYYPNIHEISYTVDFQTVG